jgi:teichuronic acid biosynthesis glycosyltransferase TuaC
MIDSSVHTSPIIVGRLGTRRSISLREDQRSPVCRENAVLDQKPRILLFSSLFPSDAQPMAGLFIRERMFRLGKRLPLVVVSPQPWFPLQSVIRWFWPGYRNLGRRVEKMDGVEIHRPRFLSLPGALRHLDGFSMAICSYLTARRLRKRFSFNVIDSHFAYPDGYAATRLAKWISVPVTVTLRGTEIPLARFPRRRACMIRALRDATRVFAVSRSLQQHAIWLGTPAEKTATISNGIDIDKFYPVDKAQVRKTLGIPAEAKVLISVGALIERKGMHRIIRLIPRLRRQYPEVIYLIVGGSSAAGAWRAKLESMVRDRGLEEVVRFLGPIRPEDLHKPLSASDIFVLATRNEGWANVFLEAMACGLPVVSTDVGGNSEVVCRNDLGSIVPFDDQDAMFAALANALERNWDRKAIIKYAKDNVWEYRIDQLETEFRQIVAAVGTNGEPETHGTY